MKCVGDFVCVSVRAKVGKALAECFFDFRVFWVVVFVAILISMLFFLMI